MRKSGQVGPWVVYRMTLWRKHSAQNAVCEQSEWDAMELSQPGYHTLVREGIATESEAELLARGTSGDLQVRGRRNGGAGIQQAKCVVVFKSRRRFV